MPNPTENPVTAQEQYQHHLRYDGVGGAGVAGALFTHDFLENLFGHRSGVGNATPWSTPPTRPLPSWYQSANGTGVGTTYAATTLTDTGATWGVGDTDQGGTVTYGANTVTDTARNNANAWVVGNTAQYAGVIIRTVTGKTGIIASVAAGVATLAANWSGGTPAAGEQYAFYALGSVGRTLFSIAAGAITKAVIQYHIGTIATFAAWTNGIPANGTPYILGPDAVPGTPPPSKFSDNWWATLRVLYNPANL